MMPTSDSLRAAVEAWRDAIARAAEARLRGADVDARAAIEAQLRGRGLVLLLAPIRRRIEATEEARVETRAGLPGEDPEVLRAEVDAAIEDLLRDVPREKTLLAALDEARSRLRVHVDGPFIERKADIDKLADVEAARLIDQVHGRIGAAEARQVLRGEIYSLLLSSPKWKWFQGEAGDRAMRAGRDALLRALQRAGEPAPSGVRLAAGDVVVEARPTRRALEALLIQIARQIQDEVPRGEGTDADVQRITDLWKWALSPFLRPFYLREHPGAPADELRGPFDSLVHDLVELAFRELGHARITSAPFGGRPAAEWIKEMRRKRDGVVLEVGPPPVNKERS